MNIKTEISGLSVIFSQFITLDKWNESTSLADRT